MMFTLVSVIVGAVYVLGVAYTMAAASAVAGLQLTKRSVDGKQEPLTLNEELMALVCIASFWFVLVPYWLAKRWLEAGLTKPPSEPR